MLPRILIFDDELYIRKPLSAILAAEGCEVFTFDDPTSFPFYRREGCWCGSESRCADILITDMSMPRVSGMEFVESLKVAGCAIPCMALMSGHLSKADEDRAKTLGLHIFLKPFEVNDICSWLMQCRKKILPNRVLCDMQPGSFSQPAGQREATVYGN